MEVSAGRNVQYPGPAKIFVEPMAVRRAIPVVSNWRLRRELFFHSIFLSLNRAPFV